MAEKAGWALYGERMPILSEYFTRFDDSSTRVTVLDMRAEGEDKRRCFARPYIGLASMIERTAY
jgi:hypothetical protein